MRLPDGTVLQTGLAYSDTEGLADSSFPFILPATVIEVFYPDSELSVSKTYMEYNVIVWRPRVKLHNVPQMTPRYNKDHGQIPVFRKMAQFDGKQDPSLDQDADHVLVAFMNGNMAQGVILGGFPHRQSKASAELALTAPSKEDGETHRIVHKGSTVLLKDDGEVEITSSGEAKAILHADGHITVLPKAGEVVDVGESPDSWGVHEGELRAHLEAFYATIFNLHTHVGNLGIVTGPPTPTQGVMVPTPGVDGTLGGDYATKNLKVTPK